MGARKPSGPLLSDYLRVYIYIYKVLFRSMNFYMLILSVLEYAAVMFHEFMSGTQLNMSFSARNSFGRQNLHSRLI